MPSCIYLQHALLKVIVQQEHAESGKLNPKGESWRVREVRELVDPEVERLEDVIAL